MHPNEREIRSRWVAAWYRSRTWIAAGAILAALGVPVAPGWAFWCPSDFTPPPDTTTSTTTTTITPDNQTTTNPTDSGPGGSNPGTTGGSPPPGNAPEPATILSGIIGVSLSGFYALRRRRGGKLIS
jgi:hypothetical protein